MICFFKCKLKLIMYDYLKVTGISLFAKQRPPPRSRARRWVFRVLGHSVQKNVERWTYSDGRSSCLGSRMFRILELRTILGFFVVSWGCCTQSNMCKAAFKVSDPPPLNLAAELYPQQSWTPSRLDRRVPELLCRSNVPQVLRAAAVQTGQKED